MYPPVSLRQRSTLLHRETAWLSIVLQSHPLEKYYRSTLVLLVRHHHDDFHVLTNRAHVVPTALSQTTRLRVI